MQLAVSSRSALPDHQSRNFSYVVSLPDPGTESVPIPLPPSAKKVLQLRFHDVDDIEMYAPEYRRCRAPQTEHILEIIRFFHEIQREESGGDDQFAILVHCESGLSRSAASAIIGLKCLGYDCHTCFEIVCNANPGSLPNRRILRLADAVFKNTNLRQIAEERRIALFEYAGYEDPVVKLDRDYKKSLLFQWDRLVKWVSDFASRRS